LEISSGKYTLGKNPLLVTGNLFKNRVALVKKKGRNPIMFRAIEGVGLTRRKTQGSPWGQLYENVLTIRSRKMIKVGGVMGRPEGGGVFSFVGVRRASNSLEEINRRWQSAKKNSDKPVSKGGGGKLKFIENVGPQDERLLGG